jgi:hypothetical protein
MNAKINGSNKTINGKTLKDIRSKMNEMLKVEGPRGLTATTENGAEIHVELYEGQDYIRTAGGKIIK